MLDPKYYPSCNAYLGSFSSHLVTVIAVVRLAALYGSAVKTIALETVDQTVSAVSSNHIMLANTPQEVHGDAQVRKAISRRLQCRRCCYYQRTL